LQGQGASALIRAHVRSDWRVEDRCVGSQGGDGTQVRLALFGGHDLLQDGLFRSAKALLLAGRNADLLYASEDLLFILWQGRGLLVSVNQHPIHGGDNQLDLKVGEGLQLGTDPL
jgi:hypothetical protein